jgi:trans-aconitate methyltransferase
VNKEKNMPDKIDRWDPIDYEKNSDFQYESAMANLERLPIKSNQKIVDIGCGSGKITAALAKRVQAGKVTGLDLSQKMIQYAQQQYKSLENLMFIVMDAEMLEFSHHGLKQFDYDWVVSFWALSWIKQHEKVISGITQCLKEGGSIFLLVPLNNVAIENTFLELREKSSWKPYFTGYQAPKNNIVPGLYEDLMKKYGFTEVNYTHKTITKEFADKESLIKFVRPWLAYLDPIPALVQDIFLKEFIESYLSKSYPDKPIIGFDVLTITARLLVKKDFVHNEATEKIGISFLSKPNL